MLFLIGNSVVALLFFILMVVGVWQRYWAFALLNLIGMVLNIVVVFWDLLGRFDMTALLVTMPILVLVLAIEAAMIFQSPVRSKVSSPASNGKVKSSELRARQGFLLIVDEKRMIRELSRHTQLSSREQTEALQFWKQGNQVFMQHNYDEAEDNYELSIKLAPTPSAFSNLAAVMIASHRAEAALQHCEMACALDPEHHEAWFNRGRALFLLKRTEEALASFEQATKIQPNTLEPWIFRGHTLRQMHEFRQAVECYDTALRINPNRPECWYEKAVTLVRQNEIEEAIKCLEHLLQLPQITPEMKTSADMMLSRLRQRESILNDHQETALADQLEPGLVA
ncbi:MAG: tetratricopeptide repeat protein [candidate division KSB1 bacterium]|nr:tetratricopeptide repeat protein [candidate division KSB1 bacterium]MDZ7301862.1 tetratricopeptide repeat protein [candidate division KSB1 bacterium]MDZ7310245.1 tetratricopeptide repeat protein [candidate division KSB1 bacterium]